MDIHQTINIVIHKEQTIALAIEMYVMKSATTTKVQVFVNHD